MLPRIVLLILGSLALQIACSGEELSDAERRAVIESLQAYQAEYKNNRVSIATQVQKNFKPEQGGGPVRQDYRITAEGSRIYTEYEFGHVLNAFAQGADDDAQQEARETTIATFDLETNQGTKIYVRDRDGTITQAERIGKSAGIERFTSMRLAQALGWREFWAIRSGARELVDPLFVLENARSVQRVERPDGQSEIHAEYVDEIDIVFQMRFSDLPEVRLFYIRHFYPPRFDIAGQIRYRRTEDGFMAPSAIREIRTLVNDGKREIVLTEEAVVIDFEMVPADQAGEFPSIEIPDGVRIIDNTPSPADATRGDDKRPAVPAPEAETNR